MRLIASTLLVTAVLSAWTVASADDPSQGIGAANRNVFGRAADSAATAIPMQVLRAERLINLSRGNMSDAAGRAAGGAVIDSHSGRRGAPGATLSLDGLPASRTAVFLDGVRLPGGPYGVDLEQIPINFVDRVEVLRGPRSAPFGPGAEAGVVRIVTKAPQKPATADLNLAYGSYKELRASGCNGYKPNWFGYLIAAERTAGDGWADELAPGQIVPPGSPADPAPPIDEVRRIKGFKHSSNDLLLKIGADAGPTQVVALGHYHYDRNTAKDDHGGNRNDRGYQFDYQAGISAGPGIVDLSLAGSGSLIERVVDQVIPRLSFTETPLPEWKDWPLTVDSVTHRYMHRVQAECGVQISRLHRIEGGVEFRGEYLDGRHHAHAEDVAEGEPFGSDRVLVGAFVGHSGELIPAILTIEPGFRVDLSDRYGTTPSGHMGFLVTLHRLIRLRLDAGRAYCEPDIERSSHNYQRREGLVIVGNPDLKPEASIGGTFELELGEAGGSWDVSLGYFHHEIDDAMVTMPIDPWPDGTRAVRDENLGKARSMGATGRIGVSPIDWLTMAGDYTFTHERLLDQEDERGKDLPMGAVPPHVAHIELGLEIRPIKLHLTSRLGYFGEWRRRLPEGGLAWIDDRFDLGARMGRTFGRHVELFAEGYNLLNFESDVDGDGDNDQVPTWFMIGLKLSL